MTEAAARQTTNQQLASGTRAWASQHSASNIPTTQRLASSQQQPAEFQHKLLEIGSAMQQLPESVCCNYHTMLLLPASASVLATHAIVFVVCSCYVCCQQFVMYSSPFLALGLWLTFKYSDGSSAVPWAFWGQPATTTRQRQQLVVKLQRGGWANKSSRWACMLSHKVTVRTFCVLPHFGSRTCSAMSALISSISRRPSTATMRQSL